MNPEQARYEKLWGAIPQYRNAAPGQNHILQFIERARPHNGAHIIDFGCGTGRGARDLWMMCGDVKVTALDFAANCLDPEIAKVANSIVAEAENGFAFKVADLTQPIDIQTADFGYCTDVLEHIAPEDVERTLGNILAAAKRVFFAISTVPDNFGAVLDDSPLHLTVQPHAWWREQIEKLGARLDWDHDEGECSLFWASIYANGDDYCEKVGMNASDDRLRENISNNLALGLAEICPHEVQDVTVCLLAGGPSLADHEAEIIERGKRGELFITVNGTYKWLLDRGVKPAAQFMVDAREHNARFVEPIVDTCRYVFSSQAAHEAVAKVPKAQAMLFHSGEASLVKECFDAHCREIGANKAWFPVVGGSTVISRALVALAMLGFRNVEVFGWDSCLRDEAHHAYTQPENDGEHVIDISVGGRSFKCHPWMVVQANEVPKLIRYVLGKIEGFQLNVRGDGLIAHMLSHAASLAGKEN